MVRHHGGDWRAYTFPGKVRDSLVLCCCLCIRQFSMRRFSKCFLLRRFSNRFLLLCTFSGLKLAVWLFLKGERNDDEFGGIRGGLQVSTNCQSGQVQEMLSVVNTGLSGSSEDCSVYHRVEYYSVSYLWIVLKSNWTHWRRMEYEFYSRYWRERESFSLHKRAKSYKF